MFDFVLVLNFCEIIDGLFIGINLCLVDLDYWYFFGCLKKWDWMEVEFEDYFKWYLLLDYVGLDWKWWIVFKGNWFIWDLICYFEIDGKLGLLLVEVKVYYVEMCEKNKRSKVDKKNDWFIVNDFSIWFWFVEMNFELGDMGFGCFYFFVDYDY